MDLNQFNALFLRVIDFYFSDLDVTEPVQYLKDKMMTG
jgi:hypothetical protein